MNAPVHSRRRSTERYRITTTNDTKFGEGEFALDEQQSALGKMDTSALMRNVSQALLAQQSALGKMDTSAMMRNVSQALLAQQSALGKMDTSAMLRNVSRAVAGQQLTLRNLDTEAFRDSVLKPALKHIKSDDLLETVKEAPQGSLLAQDIDDIFGEIPGSGLLLRDAAQQLRLTIPFGHDLVVKRALQVVVMLIVAAAIAGVAYAGGIPAAVLTATSTPSPKKTWKAVGNAYDRLYGVGQYHPDKALRSNDPAVGPSRGHRSDW